MKHFLSFIMSLVISGLCFASEQPPWKNLVYGSYSNLRDPTFVKTYKVASVTNYWDAQRSSFVYGGFCHNVNTDGGNFPTYIYWVEQDRKIVDLENVTTTVFVQGNKIEMDALFVLLGRLNDLILRMDGFSIIDSTDNVQYRGDSAKRCEAIFHQWLKNAVPKNPNSDEIHRFGLQWKTGNEYVAVILKMVNKPKYAVAILKIRRSDRRIDEELFKSTETTRNIKSK